MSYLVPARVQEHVLGALWVESRQRLLLRLAPGGSVKRRELELEWPGVTWTHIRRNLDELVVAGWLVDPATDGRGAEANFAARLRPEALAEAAAALEEGLPGCWAAPELDLDDMKAEANLWRSPTRLALVAALVAGHRTLGALAEQLGVAQSRVRAVLLDLEARGLVTRSAGRWRYQPRALHLWAYIAELGGEAPAEPEPKVPPVESLLDVLFSGLITSAELARGVLGGRSQDQLRRAAMVTTLRTQLAYGVLYDALEEDLPAEVRTGLERRLNLEPGKADQARAEADTAADLLERIHSARGFEVVDLTAVKGAEA